MAPEASGTLAAGCTLLEIGTDPRTRPIGGHNGPPHPSGTVGTPNHQHKDVRCARGGFMADVGLRLVPSAGGGDVDLLLGRVARGDASAFEALYDELSGA